MRELTHNVPHDELEGNDFSAPVPELVARMQKVGGDEYRRLAFEQHVGVRAPIDAVILTLMQKAASVADLELYKAAEVVCPKDSLRMYEELGGRFKIAASGGTPEERAFDQAQAESVRVNSPIANGAIAGALLGAGGGALVSHLLHRPALLPITGGQLPNRHMGGAVLAGGMLGGALGGRIGRHFVDSNVADAAAQQLDAAEGALLAQKTAGALSRAKGAARIGELLSGSRASSLRAAKQDASEHAAKHFGAAVKYEHDKVTPTILKAVHEHKVDQLSSGERGVVRRAHGAHEHITHARRASRIGKVLNAEESKVRTTRAGAAIGTAAVVAGGAKAHRDSDK